MHEDEVIRRVLSAWGVPR
ncbi:hypothetical protein [Nocardioides lacusdianchii]